jgi:medium-chain acyl-[acyl-carrier-protein] hydrolase
MTDSRRPNPWLEYSKPNPQARLRLFCFPFAGGGAAIFRTWPDGLRRSVEVCPVELPGRGIRLREPLFTRLSPLVQAIAQALLPRLDKPFAFFGHSLGALVSFELARHLRRQLGLCPVQLFVSACRAPQMPDSDRPLHQLPDSVFMEELRRLNGTPEKVLQNAELMQLLLPVVRSDMAIFETHVYSNEDPLDCPISAFGGLQDGKVSHDDLAAWREQTYGSFTLRMFPGNHFFLESARGLLLRAVCQDIARLLGRITEG